MEKTGIVKSVRTQGTYESKYGLMYKYEIVFDNGDSGEYSSKKASELEDSFPFKVSQNAKYEYNENNGYWKVKPVMQNPQQGGGKFQHKDNSDDIIYSVALKEAREIIVMDGWSGNDEMQDKINYISDIAYQLAMASKKNIQKLKAL